MRNPLLRWVPAAVLVGLLFGPAVGSGRSAEPQDRSPAQLLADAKQALSSDHSRFNKLLQQLQDEESSLAPDQLWDLRYLQAVQLQYQGKNSDSLPILRDIKNNSGNPSLKLRATAQLVQANFLDHKYERAYSLAESLIATLPTATDPEAKKLALSHLVQMMNSAGQHDLALKYAREIETIARNPADQCEAQLSTTQTLLYAGSLSANDGRFQQTVDTCMNARRPVSANALQLDRASLLIDKNRPREALELLRKIAPSILKSGYQFHVASLDVTRAAACKQMGNDKQARKFALAALQAIGPESVNWITQEAFRVLFEVEKRTGHSDAALAYYEKYAALKLKSADDAKARALAYQMVRLDVLAKQTNLDALAKQNSILKLRQNLADKAVETGRLYLALLILLLVFIGIWLYRTKHSQIRFRQLAHHDGLTGIFNRQHFFDQAGAALRKLDHTGDHACLLLLDLDYFKQVNDSHGHPAGDEVLQQSVEICRSELRETDLFGRVGGEEFGVFMPGCVCAAGVEAGNRIRRRLAATPIMLEGRAKVVVTASFGLSCTTRSGYDLGKLTTVADGALYQAKNAGRNQLVVGKDAVVSAPQAGCSTNSSPKACA